MIGTNDTSEITSYWSRAVLERVVACYLHAQILILNNFVAISELCPHCILYSLISSKKNE